MASDQSGSPDSTKSSVANVPVEIFARVFATLNGERASLLSCSLVSSTWRQVSVRHLFHTIRYHAWQKCSAENPSFSSLFAFIRSSPHLARYIVVLQLYGPLPLGYRGWTELHSDELLAVTPYLPALTDLSIFRVAVVATSSGLESLPRYLRTLETGSLQADKDSAADDQDDVIALSILLRRFHPEYLVIDNSLFMTLPLSEGGKPLILSTFLSPPLSVPITKVRLMRQNNLYTCNRLYHTFFHAILAPGALHCLETACDDREAIASLYELVSSAAGRNLSSMNISVKYLIPRPGGDLTHLWTAVGQVLAACPRLHHLRLRLPYNFHPLSNIQFPPPPPPETLIYTGILSTDLPSLSVLVIALEQQRILNYTSRLDTLDIAELNRPWLRTRLPRLSRVTVKLDLHDRTDPLSREVEPIVAAALTGLWEEGLLRIITYDDRDDWEHENFALDA